MLLIYKSHGYDKFGQRTYMKYCNGAETFYTYKPQRRRLQGLKVNAGGNTIMDNAYTYDAVSNVLGVTNGAALPQSGKAGGQMSHAYTYDALYRLSSATGTYTGADGKLHTGNGLRQHAPHHLEEPAPDAGQPAV